MESIRKRQEHQKEKYEMQSDIILGMEKIEDNIESGSGDEDREEDIESEEVDEKLESFKARKHVEEMNRYRIQIFRNDIKKALWMLNNKEFYKFVEKLLGSQLEAENGVRYNLDMELSNLELWVKKTENGEMSDIKLRKIPDIYI